MKKFIAIMLLLIVTTSFVACSNNENNSLDNDSTISSSDISESVTYKEKVDYQLLIDNAILQYPSSNETFKYNVYEDQIYNYGYFVKIIGYVKDDRRTIQELQIPDKIEGYDVVSVGGFSYFLNLSDLILPNTLLNIDKDAFHGTKIGNTKLPDNIQYIDDFAFYESGIKNLVLPKSLIKIGENAFNGNPFSEIVFNDSIQFIGYRAFSFSYTNISKIILPESIVKISEEAFIDTNISEIVIYSNNVEIADNAFSIGNFSQEQIQSSTFFGYSGSTVAQYCAKNGYSFSVIG